MCFFEVAVAHPKSTSRSGCGACCCFRHILPRVCTGRDEREDGCPERRERTKDQKNRQFQRQAKQVETRAAGRRRCVRKRPKVGSRRYAGSLPGFFWPIHLWLDVPTSYATRFCRFVFVRGLVVHLHIPYRVSPTSPFAVVRVAFCRPYFETVRRPPIPLSRVAQQSFQLQSPVLPSNLINLLPPSRIPGG